MMTDERTVHCEWPYFFFFKKTQNDRLIRYCETNFIHAVWQKKRKRLLTAHRLGAAEKEDYNRFCMQHLFHKFTDYVYFDGYLI